MKGKVKVEVKLQLSLRYHTTLKSLTLEVEVDPADPAEVPYGDQQREVEEARALLKVEQCLSALINSMEDPADE